ncbi:MAG: type II toxin-antitoxin system HicB family antitoxin [Bryobacteraceae bacterium]|jgi:predicted RNase H-like HicB family nuclease
MLRYRAKSSKDTNDTILAEIPDVPGAVTYGEDREEALLRAPNAIETVLIGYAKAKGIPVVDCAAGERKHELAEEDLAKTKITQGVFLILVGRAEAPIWDVGSNHHLERKRPYVNHYSFHILDLQWGHITIKISGHPPFPAQVILNGHEYVACKVRKARTGYRPKRASI